MRSWASIIALLVIVLALGTWMYQRPPPGQTASHALSALSGTAVTRVRLEHAPGGGKAAVTTLVLERKNDEWRLTEPITARAEPFLVRRLLGIIEARSTVRYPAADLAPYGLDRPHAVLTLDNQTFTYGAINNLTREQYVLTGDNVYLVPLAYTTDLPRGADSLLARQFFGRSESPARFEFAGFSVTAKDGTWSVSPATSDASADERNAWVEAWRHASALRAVRSDARPASADMKVGLDDGRTIEASILQREPALVVLRHDERVEYHFAADSGKRLIVPPGTAVAK